MFEISEINMLKSAICFLFLFGITNAKTVRIKSDLAPLYRQTAPPYRVKQCREGCLEKFYTKEIACIQQPECSMCWDQCTSNTKINTNLNAWPLRTVSMVRNESLVTADVAWQLLNTPCQYLVTWEISGGGLKGNLITETPSVQLSLWPETVYRVQVTCRNKETELVTHSLPLTLDTSHAVILVRNIEPNKDASQHNFVAAPNQQPHHIVEEDELEQQLLEQELQNSYPQHHQITHHYAGYNSPSLGMWTLYENRQEIIMGVVIAFLIFFVVISIVFVVNRRKSRYVNDKEGLIENEAQSESNQSTPVHAPQILHF